MQTEEVGFVTKKVLVTFNHHVALYVNGNEIMALAVVAEYTAPTSERHRSMPETLKIVGLTEGRKLEKSVTLHVGSYGVIIAMQELD